MDPATIIGLTAAIQQLLDCVYKIGKSVCEAKKEINQLCSELFALKAALDHVQLNVRLNLEAQIGSLGDTAFSSSNFVTGEFQSMITFTENVIKELLARFNHTPSRFKSSAQRLTWPFVKDDVKRYIDRLERSKSWFILATTSDNVAICRESYVKLCAIDQHLRNQAYLQEQEQNGDLNHRTVSQALIMLSASFRHSVKTWLAPYDCHHFYENSLSSFQEGTGRWFLDGAFQAWLDARSVPILWLRAKPGFGKTTLLSAAISQAQLSDIIGIDKSMAYFFCSFTDQQSQEPQNMLGSFLVQLCEANPRMWTSIDERYRKEKAQSYQEPNRLDINELESLITKCSNELSKTFLFLDAPNESKHSSKILQSLLRISERSAVLRIMMTSTEELGTSLRSPLIAVVDLNRWYIKDDIKRYIEAWLRHNDALRNLPTNLKEEIQLTLLDRADGMFRWVQCQMENLITQKTAKDIRVALHNIPSTLEQTYRNILARIPKGDFKIAKHALLWLSFSLNPLTFKELCEAAIIDKEHVLIDDDVRLLHPEALLEICSSLISIDRVTLRVTLAHSSVRAYLTSQEIRVSDVKEFYLDEKSAIADISIRCLNYLRMPVFRSGYSDSIFDRYNKWPMLHHIAETLFHYLSHVTLDEPIRSMLLRFFDTHTEPRGGSFGAWVQAFSPWITCDNIESSTPLYYAARYGLLPIARMIFDVEGTKNLEVPGGVYGCTPLHVAAWAGGTEMVKELLSVGANAQETNEDGVPGLQWAVEYGLLDIELMLRAAGATIDEDFDSGDDIESDISGEEMTKPASPMSIG